MSDFRTYLCCPALLFAFAGIAFTQTPEPPAADKNAPEIATNDTTSTFQTRVNLVMVPVVVRDSKGNAIGNLTKSNFQLFDNRKEQVISRFNVDKRGGSGAAPLVPATENAGQSADDKKTAAVLPDHYVAYVFDDVHLEFGDLVFVRKAATRHIDSLSPADRAAIFTTSGRTQLDFTDDRDKLKETLAQLQRHPIARGVGNECPSVSYYQADLIINRNDDQALTAATQEAFGCLNLDQSPQTLQAMLAIAKQQAQGEARRELQAGDTESRISLQVLRDVVRRTAAMPGQRTVVLVSPGFLTPFLRPEEMEVIDRAIHSNITISTLDARGLYTTDGDASQQTFNVNASIAKDQYARASALADEDLMAELADGTGGTFYHNSNDLYAGFQRVAAAPEYVYMLGFSPQNLKYDGTFHALKVKLVDTEHLGLQARRGYFAPKHAADAEETAKQDIMDAVFSRDEVREIPLDVHTQFFKAGIDSVKLTVLARVDVKRLKYRKIDGRNKDEITVVSAIFDRNGNFITGVQKKLDMRLKEGTLESKLGSGITVRSNLDVKPGSYLVRVIVRDSEGQQMSAANSAVEIP